MTQSLTELLQTRSRQLVVTVLTLGATLHMYPQQTAPQDVRFEIVSVRLLSEMEASERSPDFFGPNVAIRIRLSTASHGVRFYSWRHSIVPAGYTVERIGSGFVWLNGNGGQKKSSESPGIKVLTPNAEGEWVALPAFTSIEWELLESTQFAGQTHAFTLFLKPRVTDDPIEVVSNTFVVPATIDDRKLMVR